MELKNLITKYALQNAVKYNGKANPGAVIGHILAEEPSLNPKEIARQVMSVIKEVNALTLENQKEELKKIAPELLEEKKWPEEKKLPELKNAKGNVIMRFEPSPSGPLHIGHAYVLGLNSEYCKKYNGKLFLRISDTNPENTVGYAYKMIEEDARWLTGDNVDEILVQSDRLEVYYRYMEQLIQLGKAYVCVCNTEEYKELLSQKQPCPCRELPKEEQMGRWKKMFDGFKQGEAVVRIKTDITHKNPAMRDFPVFRINETEHPRQGKKYRVWPLMNMAVAVDDIETKVTHVIRAKDHHDNALRHKYIYEYLNKEFPETIFVGRINFEGMPVSCSKTRAEIDKGNFSGWDDIRLPFLAALRRRGYQPETFLRYAIDVGISLTDKRVTREEFFKAINSFNKDIIDSKAHRYFFVFNPKEIVIENAPEQEIELDLHPEHKKGGRKFKTKDVFYILEEDCVSFREGKLYRLMDCLNFIKKNNKLVFDSLDYEKYKEKGEKIIHWLPKDNSLLNVNILMPDNAVVEGLGESGLNGLKVGEIIQFNRVGFCRLDEKSKGKLVFWFAHK